MISASPRRPFLVALAAPMCAAAALAQSDPPSGAQPSQAGDMFRSMAPFLLVLVGVVIVGWIVVILIRRNFRNEPPRRDGFSLEELRQMHRRGEIDDEEFNRAKAALVERARSANRGERLKGGWEESGRRGASEDE